ncbi:exonuclease domain-containing protein [Curtobacterium citreum]
MHNGYAVVDFETTGLSPAYGHRVIEIGIVHVAPDGQVEESFETVVNPDRDLGPTHIHQLRGADMAGAPSFEDVAGTLVDRLRGRVLVAHNAPFEARFLHAEFDRIGVRSPFSDASRALCTMRLALEFLPGSGRKLADCCSAYDIELTDAHEALADARATSQLLAAYMATSADRSRWDTWGATAAGLTWPRVPSTGAGWLPRRRGGAAVTRSRVDRATDRMPAVDGSGAAFQYAALLDAALADGLLSTSETAALEALAQDSGLTTDQQRRLHHRYFDDLVEAVWADGILTIQEHIQLERVAALLGIPNDRLEDAVHSRKPGERRAATAAVEPEDESVSLDESSIVTLTGEMRRGRAAIEADLARYGIRTAPAVTKKTTVLIAADVDSLSGKAKKARQYGIPILGEDVLEEALAAAR